MAGGWWLDPGVSSPADFLPAEDQNAVALVVGPGEPVLTLTPTLPPEASALERRGDRAARFASARCPVRWSCARRGSSGTDLEQFLWAPGGLERDAAERLTRTLVGDAHLTGFRAAQPRDAGPLLLALDVSWSPAPRSSGDTLRLPAPLLTPPDWGDAVDATTRRFPIVFEGTEQHRDRIHIELPRGYAVEVPPEVTVPGRWFSLFVTAGKRFHGSLDRSDTRAPRSRPCSPRT